MHRSIADTVTVTFSETAHDWVAARADLLSERFVVATRTGESASGGWAQVNLVHRQSGYEMDCVLLDTGMVDRFYGFVGTVGDADHHEVLNDAELVALLEETVQEANRAPHRGCSERG